MKAFLLQWWIVLAGFRLGSAGTGLAALRCFQCSLSVKVADFRQYQCKRFLKSFYFFFLLLLLSDWTNTRTLFRTTSCLTQGGMCSVCFPYLPGQSTQRGLSG